MHVLISDNVFMRRKVSNMTDQKWNEIETEEFHKAFTTYLSVTVNNWSDFKDSMIHYISEIDKATEVYNMENTKNKKEIT